MLHATSGIHNTGERLRVLDGIYQPNILFLPDDFAELAAILAQY